MLVQVSHALRAAGSGIRQSPFVHGVAALTIAVALFAAGLARLGVASVGRLLEGWGGEVEITLYLREGTSVEQAKALAEKLRVEEGAQVKHVTAEEALARLRTDLGEAGDVLANLPKNPLPASLEVRPSAGTRSAEVIAGMAARWTKLPEVESVEYGREWVERLEQLGNAMRGAAGVLLMIVLAAAVVVVAATLQLAIYSRREEIEIQKLVGGTDTFVKAPFLIEGAVQGLLGAGLASGGLYALGVYLGPRVREAFVFLSVAEPAPVDVWRNLAEMAGAGMALGLMGSLVAVRRFLRV